MTCRLWCRMCTWLEIDSRANVVLVEVRKCALAGVCSRDARGGAQMCSSRCLLSRRRGLCARLLDSVLRKCCAGGSGQMCSSRCLLSRRRVLCACLLDSVCANVVLVEVRKCALAGVCSRDARGGAQMCSRRCLLSRRRGLCARLLDSVLRKCCARGGEASEDTIATHVSIDNTMLVDHAFVEFSEARRSAVYWNGRNL